MRFELWALSLVWVRFTLGWCVAAALFVKAQPELQFLQFSFEFLSFHPIPSSPPAVKQ